ncbi:MAG: hypothetical protein ACM3KH_00275 [Thiobacillus sp.]
MQPNPPETPIKPLNEDPINKLGTIPGSGETNGSISQTPINPVPTPTQQQTQTEVNNNGLSENTANNISSMKGKFAPWMKLVIAIVVLVLIVIVGWYFIALISGNKQNSPLSSIFGEKCSLDISKKSTTNINSLGDISGCVKEYTQIVEPSQDTRKLNANFYSRITYKFNSLPGADLQKVADYSTFDNTANVLPYSSKASPESMARIEYSINKDIVDGPNINTTKGKTPPDVQKLFLDEIELIQNKDKDSLEHIISSNGYSKISITSEKKKISDKTYLITSRSTYSWEGDKKITAHTDIQRIVSMQAVKFTTWNKYIKSNFDAYELEILNTAIKVEHLADSLYNNDVKYLDQIADKMTKNVTINLVMISKDAKMELVN